MAIVATVTPGYVFADGEVVDRTKLNALGAPTVALSGSADGGTSVITPDGTTLELSGNEIRIKDAVVSAAKIASGVLPKVYASDGTQAMPTVDYTKLTFAHGLGAVPQAVRVVLVCQSDEQGYTAGMELPIECTGYAGAWGLSAPVIIQYADATNVYLWFGWQDLAIYQVKDARDNPPVSNLTAAKWHVKVYAQYFPS